MFSDLELVVQWLFSEVRKFASFVWSLGWPGVIVICLPLAKRVVGIFKKIF